MPPPRKFFKLEPRKRHFPHFERMFPTILQHTQFKFHGRIKSQVQLYLVILHLYSNVPKKTVDNTINLCKISTIDNILF